MTSTFLFYFMRQYFYAVTFFSCSDFTFTKELIQLFLLNCSCTSQAEEDRTYSLRASHGLKRIHRSQRSALHLKKTLNRRLDSGPLQDLREEHLFIRIKVKYTGHVFYYLPNWSTETFLYSGHKLLSIFKGFKRIYQQSIRSFVSSVYV